MPKKPRNTQGGASAPGPGDNAQSVSPALIAEAIAQYGEDRAMVARAAAHCGANLARYEAQGIDPKLVRRTWEDMGRTEQEAALKHAKLTQYLIAARVISPADADWAAKVTQTALDLTPAAGEAADRVNHARAKSQGYKAGRKGHHKDSNPYKHMIGSPQFSGWLDGLQDGLADRAERKPDAANTTQAPDTKKRREPGKRKDEAAVDQDALNKEVADELAASQDPTIH